jgi:hypothetical protein
VLGGFFWLLISTGKLFLARGGKVGPFFIIVATYEAFFSITFEPNDAFP